MALKAEDVLKDMDKLIETYALLGKKVSVLRLTPQQWECLRRDFEREWKRKNYSYPVQSENGKACIRAMKSSAMRHEVQPRPTNAQFTS